MLGRRDRRGGMSGVAQRIPGRHGDDPGVRGRACPGPRTDLRRGGCRGVRRRMDQRRAFACNGYSRRAAVSAGDLPTRCEPGRLVSAWSPPGRRRAGLARAGGQGARSARRCRCGRRFRCTVRVGRRTFGARAPLPRSGCVGRRPRILDGQPRRRAPARTASGTHGFGRPGDSRRVVGRGRGVGRVDQDRSIVWWRRARRAAGRAGRLRHPAGHDGRIRDRPHGGGNHCATAHHGELAGQFRCARQTGRPRTA
ncbi:Uncharacterised protein [Nocardia brasiliensis]|nr:Uncharacterised protein [Nocardia brasiliensis]